LNFSDTLGTNVGTFWVRGEMNKFQRMSGGEPRGHGLVGSLTFHLAPDIPTTRR
jgi:hypothetical protein